MSPKEILIGALEPLGWPIYLQGTFADTQAYPETFVTFWVTSSDDSNHYDDRPFGWDWDFTVIVYSSDPRKVESGADSIRKALKAAGFVPQGKGMDVPSDEATHTGWAADYYYREINKED